LGTQREMRMRHIVTCGHSGSTLVRLPSLDRSNGWTTSVFQIFLIAQARLWLREYQLLTCHLVQVFEFGTEKGN